MNHPALRNLLAALVLSLACVACDSSGGDSTPSFEPPDFGDAMPAVTINACDGSDVALNAWIAQFDAVYITFGATWCTACQKEAPVINQDVVARFAGKSVGVAQILIENQVPGSNAPLSLCAEWRDTLSADFDVLVDPERRMVPLHFGEAVGDLPMHLIATGDGTIRFRKVGAIPEDIGDRIEAWLPTGG